MLRWRSKKNLKSKGFNNMETNTTTNTRKKRKKYPRKKRLVLFHYAADSAYYAKACFGGIWSESIWSQDVPNNYIARGDRREFSDSEKIQRLQKRLESGKNIPFNLFACDVAYIALKHEGFSKAVCYYRPGIGWHERPAFQANKRPLPAGQSPWKLWMPGFTLIGNFSDPDFMVFANHLPETRPDLLDRFADPDTGEISPDFLMAAWLGQVAKGRSVLTARAYLYKSGEMSLRIDLGTGALCALKGGSAWVSKEFFNAPCNPKNDSVIPRRLP